MGVKAALHRPLQPWRQRLAVRAGPDASFAPPRGLVDASWRHGGGLRYGNPTHQTSVQQLGREFANSEGTPPQMKKGAGLFKLGRSGSVLHATTVRPAWSSSAGNFDVR